MAIIGQGDRSSLRANEGELSYPILRWLVVIETMVVNLPIAIPSYYGNLSAYTDSYFRFLVGKSAGENQTVWMLPAFICSSVVGFLIVDWIISKIGLFVSYMAAIGLFDLGIFLTYFTIQQSVAVVILSLMVSGGCFGGMVFVISVIYSVKMVPHRPGIASAMSCSSFGLGGFLENYLITSYLNPTNLVPNVHGVNQVFFSQVVILHNVPRSFLVIGATNILIHILGLLLMHVPLKFTKLHDTTTKNSKFTNGQGVKTSHSLDPLSTEGGRHSECHGESLDAGNVSSSNMTLDTTPDPCHERSALTGQDETVDLKPLEVLQTRSFYIVWIALSVLSAGYILLLTYYKHFGQLWIKDDVFLTTTGSVASITMVVCRLVLGALIDKVGMKRSLGLVLWLNSITMSLWYFTVIPSRWLYFAWIQVICGTTGTLYVLAPVLALKLFGKTNFASNYGLLMTSSFITSLVAPFVIPAVLENAGWFGLMAVESCFSLVALVFVLFILPDA